jgi:hypothetical protein
MQIVPFEGTGAKLPAYLNTAVAATANDDLTAHASTGFPALSIKGKQWAVVRQGERKVIMNPKDPDSTASYVDVVLIKANKNVSKTWYAKEYDPNQGDDVKPTCYSNDGVSPAADSTEVQSPKCATCRWNQWGSRISRDGQGGKGKACQDNVRVAVAAAGSINDPMLLRLPPTSIRELGEYGAMLAKRGAPYQAVVTRLMFDKESESPKVTFKAMGFLDEQTFHEVKTLAETPVVMSILGKGPGASPEVAPAGISPAQATPELAKPASKEVSTDEVVQAVQTAKPAPAAKKATAKPAVVDDLSIEIEGLSFDDDQK